MSLRTVCHSELRMDLSLCRLTEDDVIVFHKSRCIDLNEVCVEARILESESEVLLLAQLLSRYSWVERVSGHCHGHSL